MYKVLIVEDEKDINDLWRRNLSKFNFLCDCAYDGVEAIELVKKNNYDIILLDLMLPKMDGYSVCKFIKDNKPESYVMILSSLGSGDDIEKAFFNKADDFIKKPCSIKELKVRVDQVVKNKHSKKISLYDKNIDPINIGNFLWNPSENTFAYNNKELDLSKIESNILKLLIKSSPDPVSKFFIQKKVWNYIFPEDSKIVEIYIHKLRLKTNQKAIVSVRHKGYMIHE